MPSLLDSGQVAQKSKPHTRFQENNLDSVQVLSAMQQQQEMLAQNPKRSSRNLKSETLKVVCFYHTRMGRSVRMTCNS